MKTTRDSAKKPTRTRSVNKLAGARVAMVKQLMSRVRNGPFMTDSTCIVFHVNVDWSVASKVQCRSWVGGQGGVG